MLGIPKNVPNGTLLDQLACVHHSHAVRDPADYAEVVTDEENRNAKVVLQFTNEVRGSGHNTLPLTSLPPGGALPRS